MPGYISNNMKCVAYNAFQVSFRMATVVSLLNKFTSNDCPLPDEEINYFIISVVNASVYGADYIVDSSSSPDCSMDGEDIMDIQTVLKFDSANVPATEDTGDALAEIFNNTTETLGGYSMVPDSSSSVYVSKTCDEISGLCGTSSNCTDDDTSTDAYCTCPPGDLDAYSYGYYSIPGTVCLAPCNPSCQNDGNCQPTPDSSTTFCSCDSMYYGDTCDKSYLPIIIGCCVAFVVVIILGIVIVVCMYRKGSSSKAYKLEFTE